MFSFRFQQSVNDYSLFVRNKINYVIVLLVYVDDIILTGSNSDELENVRNFLKNQLFIKDLWKLSYFLGIEVIDINNGLCLNQRKYSLELLHEFRMLGCKLIKTPLEENYVANQHNDKEDEKLENITEFQKLVGKLLYLTITSPYISYSVQILSQFMYRPCKSHLKVAFRLLRYLKNSPRKGISIFKSENCNFTGYVDVNWVKCLSSRRSVTGYLVYVAGSLVSWKSKKQSTVSYFSTEQNTKP